MSQMTSSTEDRLVRCFTEALGIPATSVTDSLTYQSINEWDSISHMALVAAIETEFNLMLDTDEIIGLNTVAAARELLRRHDIGVAA